MVRTRPVRAAGAALRGGFAAIRGHLDHCLRPQQLQRLTACDSKLTLPGSHYCNAGHLRLRVVGFDVRADRFVLEALRLGHLGW